MVRSWYFIRSVCALCGSLLTILIVFCVCTSGSTWHGCHGPLSVHSSSGGHPRFCAAIGALSRACGYHSACCACWQFALVHFQIYSRSCCTHRWEWKHLLSKQRSSCPLKLFIIKGAPSWGQRSGCESCILSPVPLPTDLCTIIRKEVASLNVTSFTSQLSSIWDTL